MPIDSRDSKVDNIQSSLYNFPYHYLPSVEGFPDFSKSWRFSASYISAIKLFMDWFTNEVRDKKHLHMDYGCGDGGFVSSVKSAGKFDSVDFYGIDYDANAVRWAALFSDGEKFISDDIATLPKAKFDSGSLVEVYEHIPPGECAAFLLSIAESLKEGAPLFVTVPSTQKPVGKKHYRHFDFETLVGEFEEYFIVEEVYGFEKRDLISKLIDRLLVTKWWYVETQITNRYLIDTCAKRYRHINRCGRIALVARKK